MAYDYGQHSRLIAPQTDCGTRSVRGWRKTRRNGVLRAVCHNYPPLSEFSRALNASERPSGAFCTPRSSGRGMGEGAHGIGRVSGRFFSCVPMCD